MIGQQIGKYRVLDRIGKGGMGTVYRAMDEMLHRDVAIKVLNAELNDPEVAKRFRAEAITVARLSHPGIATIYELFEHEGQWLMVMEFVRGETLENMVSRMGPLSAQRSAELAMQALAALAHAHSMGVVHRDLKPANLMITENGAVKVMDFGIARVSGSEHLTNAGFMMGTPAYMAPEQVRGGEVDARADLYAMGVVFYRLTTAKLPFKGETAFAMVQSQVNEPPTPIALVRTDLPAWVEEIVTRALAKAPEQRFQSAAEFHEALARCMAGLPISSMYGPAGETMLTPSRMPSGAISSRPMPMPTPSASYPIPPQQPPTQPQPTMASGANSASPYGSTDMTMASPSGANARPAPTSPIPTSPIPTSPVSTSPIAASSMPNAPGSTAPVAVGAVAAAAAAPAPGKPAPKKPLPIMWIGVAGAAVIAIGVAAVMMSKGGTPPTPPAPTPTTVVEPTPTPEPPVGGDALATGAPGSVPGQPAGAGAPATTAARGTGVAPAVSPSVTPTATPGRGGAAGAATTTATGRATTPGATATPGAVTGTPTPTPGAAGADPVAAFPDVKMYEITGKRAVDKDVVLNFGGGQLTVAAKSGGASMAALTYKRITHATYVRAKDPKWDPKLASPPEGFDAGSFIGSIMRSARHWLVLQGNDHYEVLRLEDGNFRQILETLEARTGIKIDRPKSQ